ncbi:pentapeptide repeat-containing protein [Streptomyces sp. NPDC014894]|uniref:pentapeptide repeat-containing protein n=1 Tax=unclassified Streptomyces TaxID=2593676 RepID=UPI0036FDC9B6
MRARAARSRTPRDLSRLPYAHRLEPFTGEIEREGSHEWLRFDGGELAEADGGGSDFTQCAFSGVTFTGGRYRRARFDEVWLHSVRVVGADLADSSWLDGEWAESVLAGAELSGAQLRRVVFHHCKFDSVNARTARFREVSFVGCLLRDVDFGGAALTDVDFPGSTLDRVRLDRATLTGVDLRGAAGLGIASGIEALRGATVSTPQILDLAPALAGVIGLTVRDDD